ncbi:MAG: hypothetical protein GY703_16300 [Gammaproteobacteria bacterium]|nr:hypothetical protein [Gammaproteobacteria bacterium]
MNMTKLGIITTMLLGSAAAQSQSQDSFGAAGYGQPPAYNTSQTYTPPQQPTGYPQGYTQTQGYSQGQGYQQQSQPQQGAYPQSQGQGFSGQYMPQQNYPQTRGYDRQALPQQGYGSTPGYSTQIPAAPTFGAPGNTPQAGFESPNPQPYGGTNTSQTGFGGSNPQAYGGGQTPDSLMGMERMDYGIAPTSQLHSGPMHGPTPNRIPGGQVVTTKGLLSLSQNGQTPYIVLDVLGGSEKLPNAVSAIAASQGGSFSDQVQRNLSDFLQSKTAGRKDTPLVFYCQSTQCWMSYNASLRAINLGYTNVLWYRGGIEAWKMAGLQTQAVHTGYGQ